MRVDRTLCLTLVVLAVPLALEAQGGGTSGAFVVRLGEDTTFVEQYTRTPNRLEGVEVSRVANATVLRHFVAAFDGQGNMTSYEVTARPAGDASGPPQLASARFADDTATVKVTVGDSSRTLRIATPAGTIPYVAFSYALIEVLTQRFTSTRSTEPMVFHVLPLGSASSFVATVQHGASPDTIAIVFGDGNPVRVRVDADGRILGASGMGTTQQVLVDRVAAVDIPALTASFGRRPLGLLSPRDSVKATIGDASLSINYGRPSRRGREIFGGVVPWNEVWRTGANAATGFTTSRNLVMGGKTIPAGSYTLFSLPSAKGWKLIINKQTGQWGTKYDPSKDLARLDMKVAVLSEPVEQFTIAIEPKGQGSGVLRLAWENTEASIPFTAK